LLIILLLLLLPLLFAAAAAAASMLSWLELCAKAARPAFAATAAETAAAAY
jgi:hypothetical protein